MIFPEIGDSEEVAHDFSLRHLTTRRSANLGEMAQEVAIINMQLPRDLRW
jgi:hypothetical protein